MQYLKDWQDKKIILFFKFGAKKIPFLKKAINVIE